MKKTLDISKHILTPKHAKLGERETQELLERYNITTEQLPKMIKHDPALAGLGVKVGDVIKIVRQSPTSGESVFYRVVING